MAKKIRAFGKTFEELYNTADGGVVWQWYSEDTGDSLWIRSWEGGPGHGPGVYRGAVELNGFSIGVCDDGSSIEDARKKACADAKSRIRLAFGFLFPNSPAL